MTTCKTCLYRIFTPAKDRQCNNPEATRYRQQVGAWTCCPDYSSEAAK